jgi:hypothetical protein
MKSALAVLAVCLACSALRADPRNPPGPLVPVDLAHDAAWQGLLARLAKSETRSAPFEERRYFPFRREPVLLTGEIRIAPGRGLSLGYLTPDVRTVIADDHGLLLRDSRGRDRAAPAGARAQAATAVLVHVLRFDLPELQKTFAISGRREGDAWTLSLASRDRDLSAGLSAIVLSGGPAGLSRIDLVVSPTQHIEIRLGAARVGLPFARDELIRYFR